MGVPSLTRGGSVVYNCCWPSPAQSFSGLSPAGFMTLFYCLRFETPSAWRARTPCFWGYTGKSRDSHLIRHGSYRKWCLQQLYCCLCVRCPRNMSTEQLRRNYSGIHIQTYRLIGGIYEVAIMTGSSVMTYTSNFIRIGSGILKLRRQE
jgi:hypothetical protein